MSIVNILGDWSSIFEEKTEMGLSLLASREPEVEKRVGSGLVPSKKDKDVLNNAHMGNHIPRTSSMSCSK